jgi:hypothetical protein
MLEAIGQTLHAAVSLLDVRAKLLLRSAERAAAAMLWRAASGVCLGAAVLVGLIAGAIALAPVWGWPAVLGALAGVLALGGLAAWGVSASMLRPGAEDAESKELERDAVYWSDALHPPKIAQDVDAAGGHAHSNGACGRFNDVVKSLQKSAKDPVVVASAAFAIAAVMGPLRALRTATKVAAAASAAKSVARAVRETTGGHRTGPV